VKKLLFVFFSATIFMIVFSLFAFAEFVQVISEYANIRPTPDTKSIIIGEAYKDDIFEYKDKENDWIKIIMFSGEYRYIHHSLVKVIDNHSLPPFSKDICKSLVKRLKEAEERSLLASNHKYPLNKQGNEKKNVEFQKILLDRYFLEIFQEYQIQPAIYCDVMILCMEVMQDESELISHSGEGNIEIVEQEDNNPLYGLSEETRKEIFNEMMRCEDRADIEAMQYYFPGCEACAHFIEADMDKYITKFTELTENCKKDIRDKYQITEEILVKIAAEAIEKAWERPALLPIPDCCR